MGLHKLIYTERQQSKALAGFKEDDRKAARKIIADSHALAKFEAEHEIAKRQVEGSVISRAYLEVGYVGNMPSEPGTYLVVDLGCDSTRIVAVTKTDHFRVHEQFVNGSIPLERFNMKSFRWFLVGSLTPADVKGLRNLPLCKESVG